MKELEFIFFALAMSGMLIAWILFLIFGQVTVRKLRKNPAMKGKMGAEFASGYDIFMSPARCRHPSGLEKNSVSLLFLF